jgi:IS1 family transposase
MKTLSHDRQVTVLQLLVEGMSMRSVSRATGVARNTIAALLKNVGAHAKNHHDRAVRNVAAETVSADEVWGFCGAKDKNATSPEQGSIWTWIAITDAKLVLAYRVGARSGAMAHAFMADVADRLSTRVQLSTDGLSWYRAAVEHAFGWNGCDYAMVNKTYAATEIAPGRYSPSECTGATKDWVMGDPDMEKVSTSHSERLNLTLRMQSRRMTRLTNAFSKAAEFHLYATALHFAWYNWIRPHQTLSNPQWHLV